MGAARSRRASARAGFTLLELTIAMTVLLVAVTAAFSSQVNSLNLLHVTRENNTAIGDLQAAMEEVLIEPFDDLAVAGADFPADQTIATYDDLHLPGERILVTYPGYAGGAVPDPLEVVLELSWMDWKGRPRLMRLGSMKTR